MFDAPMSATEAVVLGIVQGLTEFLPISSSAHLRIAPTLMHWQDPGVAYDAVIQLGSVLAVISYFAKDLWRISIGAVKGVAVRDFAAQDVRVAAAILLGTVPIGILGILLKHLIEQPDSPIRSVTVVGIASIVMGLFLMLSEKLGTHQRSIESIGARDGLLVGFGQCMALIPGCSRSGSTLTVAMLLNLKRADAARFSFLLGIPAITLAGLLEFKKMVESGLAGDAITNLIVGFVVSTVVSYAAIAWLLKYLQHHSTWVFVIYRLIFGSAVLILNAYSIIH
jgi:undecaprenyl-diphosphatase